MAAKTSASACCRRSIRDSEGRFNRFVAKKSSDRVSRINGMRSQVTGVSHPVHPVNPVEILLHCFDGTEPTTHTTGSPALTPITSTNQLILSYRSQSPRLAVYRPVCHRPGRGFPSSQTPPRSRCWPRHHRRTGTAPGSACAWRWAYSKKRRSGLRARHGARRRGDGTGGARRCSRHSIG